MCRSMTFAIGRREQHHHVLLHISCASEKWSIIYRVIPGSRRRGRRTGQAPRAPGLVQRRAVSQSLPAHRQYAHDQLPAAARQNVPSQQEGSGRRE